jgi:phosphosulfolactate phosphohydrolase-like enzyme
MGQSPTFASVLAERPYVAALLERGEAWVVEALLASHFGIDHVAAAIILRHIERGNDDARTNHAGF